MNEPLAPPAADASLDWRASQAVFAIALLTVALANLPYFVGYGMDAPELVFSGIANIHEDAYSYLAKMRQGWEGHWRYESRFTTEPHRPALLFMFYVSLGHVARWTGLPLLAVYHLARVVSAALLLFGLDRLIRKSRIVGAARVWGFFLACFGGGLALAVAPFHFETPPLEEWLTEAYVFQSLVNFPHLAFSTAAFLWIMGDMAAMADGGSWRSALPRIALASFALAWTHPRMSLTIMSVGGAACGLERGGRPLRPWIAGMATAFLAAAPPSILILYSMRGDPVWEKWSSIPTETPNPLWMLEGFGALWPMAAWGAWRGLRERRPWATLFTAWMLVGLVLIYLPIGSQRRLMQGLSIPLAILAGCAAGDSLAPALLRSARFPRRAAIAALALFCALASSSSIAYAAKMSRYCAAGVFPWHYSLGRGEAVAWLRENAAPGEAVLCAFQSGSMIPAMSGARVVLGHWAETLDRAGKVPEVASFFDLATPRAEREKIILKHDVRYVLVTQLERLIGKSGKGGLYDPGMEPKRWRRVFMAGGVAIYRRVD